MTEPTTPIAASTPTNLPARIGWAFLIFLALYVCYFSHLGAIGFVGPDEPRYAWIARDMAETGDWVTPRLYGKPWFEKPPLFYWSAAISFKLFGVNEVAARLPSAVSALVATLALAWLALRLYGAETACWLLLFLPTSVGMIGFSHAAATDMLFSGMLTIALVSAVVVLGLSRKENPPLPEKPWLALVFFGFFLGLAVLAKGPAALILSGGAIFLWALFTKRWRAAFRLLDPAALASFCLTALPWYILCAHRNPDFFRIFIIEHNFKRFLTPEFQHLQPFWFYGPILLLATLPWTPLLFPVARDLLPSFRDRFRSGTVEIFFLTWLLFPLLFFTLSKSKLPGYILPAVPPLLLLCSCAAKELVASNSRPSRVILSTVPILTIAMIAAALHDGRRFKQLSPFWGYDDGAQIGLIVSHTAVYVLVLAAPVLILYRRVRIGLFCSVAALTAFLWLATLTILPAYDLALSSRQESQALAKLAGPSTEILLCGVPRPYSYGYAFYFRRELREWDRQSDEINAFVILGPGCLGEIDKGDSRLRLSPTLLPWPVVELNARSPSSRPRRE